MRLYFKPWGFDYFGWPSSTVNAPVQPIEDLTGKQKKTKANFDTPGKDRKQLLLFGQKLHYQLFQGFPGCKAALVIMCLPRHTADWASERQGQGEKQREKPGRRRGEGKRGKERGRCGKEEEKGGEEVEDRDMLSYGRTVLWFEDHHTLLC